MKSKLSGLVLWPSAAEFVVKNREGEVIGKVLGTEHPIKLCLLRHETRKVVWNWALCYYGSGFNICCWLINLTWSLYSLKKSQKLIASGLKSGAFLRIFFVLGSPLLTSGWWGSLQVRKRWRRGQCSAGLKHLLPWTSVQPANPQCCNAAAVHRQDKNLCCHLCRSRTGLWIPRGINYPTL